jgi:hypothetical protein
VARLGGAPRIGSENVSNKSRLGVGQWLETDANSRAKLEVANIGNVEIDPNTRVRLLQTSGKRTPARTGAGTPEVREFPRHQNSFL